MKDTYIKSIFRFNLFSEVTGVEMFVKLIPAVGTPPSSLSGDMVDPNGFDARKSDSFRANTSKTKLESLLGEFLF